MEKLTYCVYNQTRECFLCLGVTPADTMFSRLKGLIGKLKLKLDEGLWVVPSQGIHTLGVLFPLDLIYLDESQKVIHAIEHFPRFRIAPLRIQAASVLELPTHTIYSSQTQTGDQLIICAVDEIESPPEARDRGTNPGSGALAAIACSSTNSETEKMRQLFPILGNHGQIFLPFSLRISAWRGQGGSTHCIGPQKVRK